MKYHGLNQFGQVMMVRLFVDENGHDEAEHYGEYIDLCILKYSPSNGVLVSCMKVLSARGRL